MNERINYGKNTPHTFYENLQFDRDCPYKVRCKDLPNDDIAPFHYAETLEIDVCCGIVGDVVIESEHIHVDGNAVIVVPPGTVHSATFRMGPGRIYVLQVSFEALQGFVNVEALLELSGRSLENISWVCAQFEEIYQLVLKIIDQDRVPFARISILLEILELITVQDKTEHSFIPARSSISSNELRNILHWTENHFAEEIRLEDAARAIGFTKNYFCAWFKVHTGLTYKRYLNHVRIRNACRLLIQTGSVSTACFDSGFRDMSYFVQVFKKTQGVTPKTYLRNLSN